MAVSEQLRTYPSPNPTLTLTSFDHLSVVGLRKEQVCSYSHADINPHIHTGSRTRYRDKLRHAIDINYCMNNLKENHYIAYHLNKSCSILKLHAFTFISSLCMANKKRR